MIDEESSKKLSYFLITREKSGYNLARQSLPI